MENTEIWANDRLGYRTAGESFTRLITTIDQSRVLSIEAGFGRGKTFFREIGHSSLSLLAKVLSKSTRS
jgi:hypothetical protein